MRKSVISDKIVATLGSFFKYANNIGMLQNTCICIKLFVLANFKLKNSEVNNDMFRTI